MVNPRRDRRPRAIAVVGAVVIIVALLGACTHRGAARSATSMQEHIPLITFPPTTLRPVVQSTNIGKLRRSPTAGPRGSVIAVSGTGCKESVANVSFYGPRGDPAAASARVPVPPDHTWAAHLVVPADALVGHEYAIDAFCGDQYTFDTAYQPDLYFHVVASTATSGTG